MSIKKSRILFGLLISGLFAACDRDKSAVNIFSTNGHTVYHVHPATVVAGGGRVIISAAYDGAVLCHTPTGQLRWKAETGGNFLFDLCVADINGDGLDETLVASADGVLYAIGPDGKPLWSFKKGLPLYQVCAAKQPDSKCIILTGGVEQILYALSPRGELRGQLSMGICIRHLRAGDILGQGREYVAMAMVDLDHDGKQEIVLSGSRGQKGKIYAYDGAGKQRFAQSDPLIPDVPYRMIFLVPVKLPNDEYIIGQFGNILIVYNLDGSCRGVVTGQFAYSNATFDPATRTLYCGSEVSGRLGLWQSGVFDRWACR